MGPVPWRPTVTLTDEQKADLNRLLWPVLRRNGAGGRSDCCAWCGGFVISQYGVPFKNPHHEDCEYASLLDLLGVG